MFGDVISSISSLALNYLDLNLAIILKYHIGNRKAGSSGYHMHNIAAVKIKKELLDSDYHWRHGHSFTLKSSSIPPVFLLFLPSTAAHSGWLEISFQ